MAGIKLIAFSGSSRSGSVNRKLIEAAKAYAESAGSVVTLVDLRELEIPMYDGDIQARSGIPESARELKKSISEQHGLLIASPEYNGSFSPLLKNALDWTSRGENGEPALTAFDGKVAAIMSASPGALGGLRGLAQLRAVLTVMKTIVIPQQLAIGNAGQAFDDSGKLREANQQKSLEHICSDLVRVASLLHPSS